MSDDGNWENKRVETVSTKCMISFIENNRVQFYKISL